jgi:hypothetical protein
MSTGVSAKQAGGLENLYGAKSIRETFGGRGTVPKEGLTPEVNPLNSKAPLQQKTTDLNTLYKDATVAQAELNDVTRLVSQKVGGEPLIPPSLKGRDRTQQKIEADYGGDASRITDLARSSIICENPQQIYKALGELKGQGNVVRVKDRFENPVNGYRDMLVNVEMSNGHIVEVQLHLRSVMEVKNGAGHKLYEESRGIYAKAKMEGRELTPQEQTTVTRLEQQQKQLYDDAYQKATVAGKEKSGDLKDGSNAPKIGEKPKGSPPDWKASMTDTEAGAYTKDSYYEGKTFYHGTNVRGATSISERGINPDKFDELSTYGPGFYVGNDRKIAGDYAKRKAGETGETGAVIGVKLKVEKPKVFKTGNEYQEAVTKYVKQSGMTHEEWSVAYTNGSISTLR